MAAHIWRVVWFVLLFSGVMCTPMKARIDPKRVHKMREKLLAHWWFDDLPPEAVQADTLQPWWSKAIVENGVCLPENRTGFLVPYDPDNQAELATSLPGITENIV